MTTDTPTDSRAKARTTRRAAMLVPAFGTRAILFGVAALLAGLAALAFSAQAPEREAP